ncbi:MAG: VOC family protein [Novosphingobium sp.]|nr:VOC family protein [Novosphingobium sp.]
MSDKAGVAISHFAVCVSDLDRSRKFYTKALGFTVSHEVDVTPPFGTLVDFPEIDGHAIFMMHGGLKLELNGYSTPEVIGPAEPRPMNQLGLTHMAFVVENLAETIERIAAHGGTLLRHTHINGPVGEMMFATDPDGTRLELWEKKDPA